MLFLIGQSLIGLFYLATGFYNVKHFKQQAAKLEALKCPLPQITMLVSLVLHLGGGLLLTINVFPLVGAIAVFVFTVIATAMFQRFWSTQDPMRRTFQFFFFVEHVAVLGALLMIMSRYL